MSHPTLDLKRTYLALRRALEHTIKSFGFTGGQFDVLQMLMQVPELEHRELQRQLAISSPTLTNILDVLERNGHIRRSQSQLDARVTVVKMTDEARSICFSKEFCDAGDKLVEEMFAGLSTAEAFTLMKLLARVESNLEKISA